MKIIIATAVGKNDNGKYYDIFPSRWSATADFHTNTYYPFDLAYLSSMLKNETNHQIKMIDGNYQGFTVDVYAENLVEEQPDLIIMEADSLTYADNMKVINNVKSRIPCKALLCGSHPTAFPQQTLLEGADYVAIGEFQTGIVNLIKSDFSPDTAGIYPNRRAELFDVEKLPFPEDNDISRRDYCRLYACEYRQIEMFPTRGCPVNCNYCVVRNVYHGQGNIRCRPVSSVIEEMNYLLEKYPDIEGFFFNEESHTANKKYVHELCDALIESGLNKRVKLDAMCNFAAFDDSLLIHMKEAGYYKIRVGIETFDESAAHEIFSGSWKKNIKKMMEVLTTCRDIGMKVYVTMSVGTIGSTPEKDLSTLETVKRMYQDNLFQEFQVSINTPLPGTPFYDEARENGWLVSEDFSDMDGNNGSIIDLPEYPKYKIDEIFRKFQDFRYEVINKNRDNGVNYSMYDREWVRKVLEMTQLSKNY